jgi:hypothetical protein
MSMSRTTARFRFRIAAFSAVTLTALSAGCSQQVPTTPSNEGAVAREEAAVAEELPEVIVVASRTAPAGKQFPIDAR